MLLARVKGSAQRKMAVAKSKQAVSGDVSDYRLKFLRKHSVTIIAVLNCCPLLCIFAG